MKNMFLWTSILISIAIVYIIFIGIKNNQFLFLHDESLVLSSYDPSGSFYTNDLTDLGTANTMSLIVTLLDRIYYSLFLSLNVGILTSQIILYFVKIFLSIWVPFIGLKKVSKIFSDDKVSELAIYVVSLWYAFNTYTVIYWHGNAFSLTLLVCYVLAPGAFYYYYQSILTNKVLLINRLIFVVTLFLMSLAIYLFPVFILLLALFTIIFLIKNISMFWRIVLNLVISLFLFLPLSLIFLVIPYNIIYSGTSTLNSVGGSTYSQLEGALLYPVLMWFSWGIYTVWEPRNIFTFHSYFKTFQSIIAPFILYFLIFYDFFKTKKPYFKVILLICLVVMIFLIKGPQAPFGEVYTFLIQNISVFRVFRSPDNKFGFGIVLLISLLLLIASQSFKQKVFVSMIIVVIFIQGFLLFNGVAIKGENTVTSADRIIKLGNDYKEYVEYINSQDEKFGYVVAIPPVTFANYDLGDGERHWGQDLLPKLTKYPYIYINGYGGMNFNTFSKISEVINRGEKTSLSEFPVRFYVVRKDVLNYALNEYQNVIENIENNLPKVYENDLFSMYENHEFLPLINGNGVEFTRISPVEYRVLIRNLDDIVKLGLLQNYNKNWNLYLNSDDLGKSCENSFRYESANVLECRPSYHIVNLKNVFYSFKRPMVSNINNSESSYYNTWVVSKEEIINNWKDGDYTTNEDGSINVSFTIYFKTQAVFYLLALISGSYLVLILFLISIVIKKGNFEND